jgi:hypothetical protein
MDVKAGWLCISFILHYRNLLTPLLQLRGGQLRKCYMSLQGGKTTGIGTLSATKLSEWCSRRTSSAAIPQLDSTLAFYRILLLAFAETVTTSPKLLLEDDAFVEKVRSRMSHLRHVHGAEICQDAHLQFSTLPLPEEAPPQATEAESPQRSNPAGVIIHTGLTQHLENAQIEAGTTTNLGVEDEVIIDTGVTPQMMNAATDMAVIPPSPALGGGTAIDGAMEPNSARQSSPKRPVDNRTQAAVSQNRRSARDVKAKIVYEG